MILMNQNRTIRRILRIREMHPTRAMQVIPEMHLTQEIQAMHLMRVILVAPMHLTRVRILLAILPTADSPQGLFELEGSVQRAGEEPALFVLFPGTYE